MTPKTLPGFDAGKISNPLDLINRHMQAPAEEVATDYVADMVFEIAASGLSDGEKIERIKSALNEYRVTLLRYVAQSNIGLGQG
ncbi:hypothetical protein [Pseudomonas sp. S1(2024)]|uniref:hypothetical protein n=1 Tax=Pseudomonas sp. S1(2024) TaxID=3390191 RepID=UPI003978897F